MPLTGRSVAEEAFAEQSLLARFLIDFCQENPGCQLNLLDSSQGTMDPMDYFTTFPPTAAVPLDPQVAADLRARAGSTPFYQMSPAEGRAAFEALLAAAPKLNDPVADVK